MSLVQTDRSLGSDRIEMFNSTSMSHRNLMASQMSNVVGSCEVIVLMDGERDIVGLAHTIYLDPFLDSQPCRFLFSFFLLLCYFATNAFTTNLTVGSRMMITRVR